MTTDVPLAIVGAGPYGLALAAHLRARGVPHRIFGTPMGSWRSHMPEGMFLKSEGAASSIAEPGGRHTLERYCAEHGLEYGAVGVPVPLSTFVGYGLWFQRELVPDVEDRMVEEVAPRGGAFLLRLAGGETLRAGRVVIASGFQGYAHVPDALEGLPPELASHSSDHTSFGRFATRDVTVVGAGQSALETAALLHEAGACVRVLARGPDIVWNTVPADGARPLRQRLRDPSSGLGNGLSLWCLEHLPDAFRRLPARQRIRLVKEVLGPAGAWWLRGRLEGEVALVTGATLTAAAPANGGVRLTVNRDGRAEEIATEHVIAGTGFRPEVARLPFLGPSTVARIRRIRGAPVLSSRFESTVPGLHFVGLAAALSFGPPCRFVVGARFAARRLSAHLAGRA
jgi:hypothetical protein